jgi:hypothetical protein
MEIATPLKSPNTAGSSCWQYPQKLLKAGLSTAHHLSSSLYKYIYFDWTPYPDVSAYPQEITKRAEG